jgi:hypothetical protein
MIRESLIHDRPLTIGGNDSSAPIGVHHELPGTETRE